VSESESDPACTGKAEEWILRTFSQVHLFRRTGLPTGVKLAAWYASRSTVREALIDLQSQELS